MKKAFSLLIVIMLLLICVVNSSSCKSDRKNRSSENVERLSKEKIFRIQDKLLINKGKYFLEEDLVIDENEILVVKPGVHLIFSEGKRLIVNGRIVSIGTKKEPIIFDGNGKYWRGIKIEDKLSVDSEKYKEDLKNHKFETSNFLELLSSGNIFLYCKFNNLATEYKFNCPQNRVLASIEVKNSALIVANSEFTDNFEIGCIMTENSLLLVSRNVFIKSKRVMKMIHTLSSVFLIHDCLFDPDRYDRALWQEIYFNDKSIGILAYNKLNGVVDDGVAFDNETWGYIIGNKMSNLYDDGIDIDSNSVAFAIDNKIKNVDDHGLLVSNHSKLYFLNGSVSSAKCGITIRSGGTLLAENIKVSATDKGILMFQGVPIALSFEDFSRLENEILKIKQDQINYYGFYFARTKEALLQLFRESYCKEGNFWVIKSNQLQQDLKNLFKIIKNLQLNDVAKEAIRDISKEKKQYLLDYQNSIYLKNSKILNSKIPLYYKDFFSYEFDDVVIGDKNENVKVPGPKDEISDSDKLILKNLRQKKKYINKIISKSRNFIKELSGMEIQ